MRKLLIVLFLLLVIALPVSGMSIALPTYSTLEEYNAYIVENKGELPLGFVRWEDIAFMGQFDCMVDPTFESVYYSFIDQAGIMHSLTIYYPPQRPSYEEVGMDALLDTDRGMRKITNNTGEGVVIKRNGLHYYYDRFGELTWIFWYKNGAEYHLSGNLLTYPKDSTNTIIDHLLSTDEEEFEIARKLIAPDRTTFETRHTIYTIIGIVAVGALVAVTLVGVLKRKPQVEEVEEGAKQLPEE